jgi:hypothetical protein
MRWLGLDLAAAFLGIDLAIAYSMLTHQPLTLHILISPTSTNQLSSLINTIILSPLVSYPHYSKKHKIKESLKFNSLA